MHPTQVFSVFVALLSVVVAIAVPQPDRRALDYVVPV
ncbi:hypothetical protein SUNI508_09408 [Seiridium unicorne]|uniref:Uncharacterized protein n=1 Tax=Seiridium unicorne TaxID=138068 RepID=A0ABR2UPX1_9PEZI